ncbi:MAG: YqaA family protein [Anaerolineae bacterium]
MTERECEIKQAEGDQTQASTSTTTPQRMGLKIALLIFVAAVAIVAYVERDRLNVAWFRTLGYAGVFLMALIGSSTVLLPIPHLAFTFTMGAVLNPWLVGLSAGVGDALGEITGYVAGYAVEDLLEERELYVRLKRYMARNGDLTIFVLSLFPVPFFDLAAMAGGLVGYPLWRFTLATWAGKTIKAGAAAWAGHAGVGWVADLLRAP